MKDAMAKLNELREHKDVVCFFAPTLEHGRFIIFDPGTGDNLLPEDYNEGFVDYVNWQSFNLETETIYEPAMIEIDGGMLLLKEPYEETPIKEIITGLLYEAGADDPNKAAETVTPIE